MLAGAVCGLPMLHLSTLARAAGHAPGPPEGQAARAPAEQQHPLIVELSKEGYNVLAEFDAALDAEAYREACRIISASAAGAWLGVLPDRKDRRLWVSFPTAVESAMRDSPALRRAMQEEFGPLGEIRLKQAIAAGDTTAVEAVAAQFAGTTAAAEAHGWLGDRGLSAGRFAEASGHYREAMQGASAAQRGGLLARLRLAGALIGRNVGEPIAEAVQIGNTRLAAGEFERLVGELRETRRSLFAATGIAGNGATLADETGFAPGRYEVRPWAGVDGQWVKKPYVMPARAIDWAGRQIAVLVAGGQMFVNNQVQLTAFDLETGRRNWAHRGTVEDKNQQWALLPMQPVVFGSRICTCRLSNEGPELACMDTGDGRLLWSTKPDGYVASDPMLIGETVAALTVSYEAEARLALGLAVVDARSGRVLLQTRLCEFRDLWQRRLPCRTTFTDAGIVATAGGGVLCCDTSGRVRWLRRQAWTPPPTGGFGEKQPWLGQVHRAPLVNDGLVYATQPGVWSVDCLDLETGRLVWHRAVDGLQQVVGCASQRLLVRTTDGLLAMDPRSGKTLWSYQAEHPLATRLCGQHGVILVVGVEEKRDGTRLPEAVLVWLDVQSGQPRSRSVLGLPGHADPWVGPLVGDGSRQWVFAASAVDPANRAILELLPVAQEASGGAAVTEAD